MPTECSMHLTISKWTWIALSAIPFCSGVYGTVVSWIMLAEHMDSSVDELCAIVCPQAFKLDA
jgi:hypothetical protein